MKRTTSSRSYTLTLEGPYGEIKKIEIEVPFHFTAAKGQATLEPAAHESIGDAVLTVVWLSKGCIALRDAVREDIKDIPASTNDSGRWVEFIEEGHKTEEVK